MQSAKLAPALLLLLSWLALPVPAAAADPPAYRLGPVAVAGDEADQLQFGVGAFDVNPNDGADKGVHDGGTVEGRIEYRLGEKLYGVAPLLGLAVTATAVSTAMPRSTPPAPRPVVPLALGRARRIRPGQRQGGGLALPVPPRARRRLALR